MHSVVMSPFLHDFIKADGLIQVCSYQECFNSHSAWFLDGRTSILVCVCNALSLNYIGYESDGNSRLKISMHIITY